MSFVLRNVMIKMYKVVNYFFPISLTHLNPGSERMQSRGIVGKLPREWKWYTLCVKLGSELMTGVII